jgi:hypothetical protein
MLAFRLPPFYVQYLKELSSRVRVSQARLIILLLEQERRRIEEKRQEGVVFKEEREASERRRKVQDEMMRSVMEKQKEVFDSRSIID